MIDFRKVLAVALACVGLFLCLTQQPHAQLSTTHAGLGAPASVVTFSLTFTDHKENTNAATTLTFNAGGDPSIGAADPNRIIAVYLGARFNSASVQATGMTIGCVNDTVAT